jgi:hypothetical protein
MKKGCQPGRICANGTSWEVTTILLENGGAWPSAPPFGLSCVMLERQFETVLQFPIAATYL